MSKFNPPGNVGIPSGFTQFLGGSFESKVVIAILVAILIFAVYRLIKSFSKR